MQENREWLSDLEKQSEALRESNTLHDEIQNIAQDFLKKNTPKALSQGNQSFIDGLVKKKQEDMKAKPVEGALYFVSFSIPEEGLKRMLHESRRFGIPATLRGMVNNDMRETVRRIHALVKDGKTDGVQIDPVPFQEFGIRAVPVLVVRCEAGRDIVSGNLRIESALRKIAESGDCAAVAKKMLVEGGAHE
ncbi:type-F conjugative transfer system pilin assembly protein TrbC [Serratia sp. S1B]|nr:type-F conjugative transfer system pilin assembly protein TrbC [Serratia sp. S1B]